MLSPTTIRANVAITATLVINTHRIRVGEMAGQEQKASNDNPQEWTVSHDYIPPSPAAVAQASADGRC
jgi:hypothetical protein